MVITFISELKAQSTDADRLHAMPGLIHIIDNSEICLANILSRRSRFVLSVSGASLTAAEPSSWPTPAD
jgi:hypothetical protein